MNKSSASRKRVKKSPIQLLGNTLMLAAVLGIFLIYLPVIKIYLFPPRLNPHLPNQGYFISIPKIQAEAKVIPDVNPWNESEYNAALEKGVAQAKGTALPGDAGTIYLFAHSSNAPWRLTYINTIFLKLGQLQNGDSINLYKDGQEYSYKVTDKKVVWPDQIEFLTSKSPHQLILQTCTPIGTSFKRLLVFADQK